MECFTTFAPRLKDRAKIIVSIEHPHKRTSPEYLKWWLGWHGLGGGWVGGWYSYVENVGGIRLKCWVGVGAQWKVGGWERVGGWHECWVLGAAYEAGGWWWVVGGWIFMLVLLLFTRSGLTTTAKFNYLFSHKQENSCAGKMNAVNCHSCCGPPCGSCFKTKQRIPRIFLVVVWPSLHDLAIGAGHWPQRKLPEPGPASAAEARWQLLLISLREGRSQGCR